ncbi:unnamed protein product [Symbiodinium sp. CCMP2456]|nr:unnamed protein product [Symbiodinium sp. CCMP2456]
MAAAEQSEAASAPVEHVRREAFEVELFVGDTDTFQPGESISSTIGGPLNFYRFQMTLYPHGLKEEEGLLDRYVAVNVQMLPPRELAGCSWSCEEVEVEVVLHNWYDYGVHCWDVMTFQNSDDTCRFGSILPSNSLQVDLGWLNSEKKVLVVGRLKLPIPKDAFGESIRALDLSQEVTQVTFQLSQGPRLFMDKRLLISRSEYFKEMLSEPKWKEARTNIIDLRSDTSVDHRSFSALLFFIMSNTFTAGGDTNFAFAVRRLADRYRLPQLVEKIEVELVNMLSADNVLTFLGQVVGSGGLLELACLEMIKADECEILKSKHETLDQIIEDHPDLAKRIMRLLVGRTGKKRPLGGD